MTGRWDNKNGPVAPFSISFQHDPRQNLTTYIVSGDPIDSCVTSLKQWLGFDDGLTSSKQPRFAQTQAAEYPFLILAKCMQANFEQAKVYVEIVKDRLMRQVRSLPWSLRVHAEFENIDHPC